MKGLMSFRSRNRSSEKVLARLVAPAVYREMVATVPDWRDRFRLAGEKVGLNEVAIMEKIAEGLGLPFLEHLADLEVVCGVTIEEALGVAYLESDGERKAVVCIDPIRLDFLPSGSRQEEIFVAPWTEIKGIYGGVVGERNVSRKIYDLVVDEARAHGASNVVISSSGEYSFTTSRGELGRGVVSAGKVQSFLSYLKHKGVEENERGFRVSLPDRTRRGVWIVDDDRDFVELLRGILVRRGHTVTSFTDPTAALERLELLGGEELVIVVDQNMAKMQGLEFAVTLLESPASHRFKIIMVTSAGSPELFTTALNSGVEVCVDKGQDLSILAAYVEQRSQVLCSSVSDVV